MRAFDAAKPVDVRIERITAIVCEVFDVKRQELGRSKLTGREREARSVVFGLASRIFDMSSVELSEGWGCSYKTAREGVEAYWRIEDQGELRQLADRAHSRVRSWLASERQPYLD